MISQNETYAKQDFSSILFLLFVDLNIFLLPYNSEKRGNMGGKERVKEEVSRFEGALLDQPNVQWLAQHLL